MPGVWWGGALHARRPIKRLLLSFIQESVVVWVRVVTVGMKKHGQIDLMFRK